MNPRVDPSDSQVKLTPKQSEGSQKSENFGIDQNTEIPLNLQPLGPTSTWH